MSCNFDNVEIDERVTITSNGPTECSKCSYDNKRHVVTGLYKGHAKCNGLIVDAIQTDEYSICEGCGFRSNHFAVICGDDQLCVTKEFERISQLCVTDEFEKINSLLEAEK